MLLATAATATAADDVKFEFHGFVGASLYTENAVMNSGGGQAAWFVSAVPTVDKSVLGGDVRQSRLNFTLTGPQLWENATARAFAEIDFFGTTPAGPLNDVSISPRLRVAFAELKLGNSGTVIRAGQDHDLVLGIILPTTVGHVAFPLSYQSGTIGWRRPQIAGYQTFALGPDFKLELALAIGRANWTAATPAEAALGQASGKPSYEGRVKLQHKIFEAFAATHYSQIDVNGQGVATAPGANGTLDTTVFNIGGKVSYLGATLQGSAYTGKNLGPLAGDLLQWQPAANLALPGGVDVSEVGYWLQAGYTIPVLPELSVWALTGLANPDDADLVKAGLTRSRNQTSSFLVRYQNKGYTAGIEYSIFRTAYTNLPDVQKAEQFMLSGMYFF
ncbi:MAG TPA: hypothetical protein VF841_05115 [Anaeromyxobacter sp.]